MEHDSGDKVQYGDITVLFSNVGLFTTEEYNVPDLSQNLLAFPCGVAMH